MRWLMVSFLVKGEGDHFETVMVVMGWGGHFKKIMVDVEYVHEQETVMYIYIYVNT